MKRSVEYALRHDLPPQEIAAMLRELLGIVEPASAPWVLAHRTLADVLVEESPWQSAIAARVAIKHDPTDASAHAVLALALTLLGHYHAAATSYREAVALAPDNPSYSHNLGHLLDAGLHRPAEALPHLRHAHKADPHIEIAASLAHALGRTGQPAEGRKILSRALGRGSPSAEHAELLAWLEKGAPMSPTRCSKGAGKLRMR